MRKMAMDIRRLQMEWLAVGMAARLFCGCLLF
jgi:hypothetical protein